MSMRIIFILVLLSFSINLPAQKTTYSKYEDSMIRYANNGWAYADKYDSLLIAQNTLDSCWRFIKNYPNSFAKPNVLSFMLKTAVILNNSHEEILQLIDSVLTYDKLPITGLWIAEILIERNIDIQLGRDIINKILPDLTVPYHKYRSYMLLAATDLSKGYYSSARDNYKAALSYQPERLIGWYEYLGFLKMSEFPNELVKVETRIKELEENELTEMVSNSDSSPNINKSLLEIELKTLDNDTVHLSDFKGKVILINQFNFWCGWCIKEFPILKKIIVEFPEVEFIFLNSGEKPDELRNYYFKKDEYNFLEKANVFYTTKSFSDKVYGHSVPQTFIVDKMGNIRFDYLGYNKELESILRRNLKKLLNE